MTGRILLYSARDKLEPENERSYGYEKKRFYKDLDFDRVHYNFPSKTKLVRAFEQMWQVTNNIPEKNFVKTANQTRWTLMIEHVLFEAFKLVKNLRTHTVLIQCYNGKDASSVLSSLVQIISDPYYRTFEGFRALIFKEWIFTQHNFVKKLSLMLLGQNGEEMNGQVLSSEIKISQN